MRANASLDVQDRSTQSTKMMAKHQLGVDLTDDEASDIEHRLGSLTGDLPRAYIAKPALPAGK
jgi:hypothetical protein